MFKEYLTMALSTTHNQGLEFIIKNLTDVHLQV